MQKGLQKDYKSMDATLHCLRLTNIHPHDTWHSKHWTNWHTNRTASWQTTVCSECTLIWKQPQLSAATAGSVLCTPLERHDLLNFCVVSISVETVTGHPLVKGGGLVKRTIGHVSVLLWDVWIAIFLSLMSENTYICTSVKMWLDALQEVSQNEWWAYVNKTASRV